MTNRKSIGRRIQIIGFFILALYVLRPMGIVTSIVLYYITFLPGGILILYGIYKEWRDWRENNKKDEEEGDKEGKI